MALYLDSLHGLSRDELYKMLTDKLYPQEEEWCFPQLFKKRKDSKIHCWTIGYDGEQLYTESGLLNGKMTVSPVAVPPRKTSHNHFDQAFYDARSRYVDKIVKGYRFDIDSVPDLADPMLASKYQDEKTRLDFPLALQEKLDGYRMMAIEWGDRIFCRSRKGKEITTITHIIEALEVFLRYLPEGCELDGELYSHGTRFNAIQSIISTKKHRHPSLDKIQYVIFDVRGTDLSFEERFLLLRDAFEIYVEDGHEVWPLSLLEYELVHSHQEILDKHAEITENGYEGVILRVLDSLYEPGRSRSLIKFKSFEEEEGIVVGINRATGNQEGAAILSVQDIRGVITPMSMKGTIEQRRYWADHPEEVIGQTVNFSYQELSEKGVPRFPEVTGFRDAIS